MRLFPRAAAIGMLMAGAAAGAAPAERFGLEHLKGLVRVSEPRLSPSGERIAVLVTRVNEPDNRYETELALVEVATRGVRVLSRRPGLSSPRFTPDGASLVFVADDATGQAQAFVVPVAGGEPRRITEVAGGVEQIALSPDGTRLAFIAPDPAPKRAGLERWNDGFEVGHDGFRTMAAPRPSHLWLVPYAGGAPRRLTSGASSLSTSLGTSPIAWSPDGTRLAIRRTLSAHSGDAGTSWIETVDAATGAVRAFTGSRAGEGHPAFSGDGTTVAYLASRDGDPGSGDELHAAPAGGGPGRTLSRGLDRSIGWFFATPSGFLVGGNDHTRVGLWALAPGGAARPLELGPVVEFTDLDRGPSGAIALAGSERARPPELYFKADPDAAPVRLTDFNRDTAALALGRSEALTWTSSDGVAADGVVTFPPDFDAKRRWPLVLYIHGGPTGSSNESFSELAQLLAARGFVVLQPNYRGSDNLGDAFQRGIVSGAGSGPGRDVIAGVEALKRLGYVDPERVAVSGWSYGGFMTVWMLGHYPGFRAAVAGAAALDLVDMYALSDLNVMPRHAITGSPWTEGREAKYREESPLTNVTKIETPTLILSCAGDSRVAVTQSYKLFRALEDRKVETQFVAYPCTTHLPPDPVRQRDVYARWIAWLETRLAP